MKKAEAVIFLFFIVVFMVGSVSAVKIISSYRISNIKVSPQNLNIHFNSTTGDMDGTTTGVPATSLSFEANIEYRLSSLQTPGNIDSFHQGHILFIINEVGFLRNDIHGLPSTWDRSFPSRTLDMFLDGFVITDEDGLEYTGYALGRRDRGLNVGGNPTIIYHLSFEAYSRDGMNRMSGTIRLELPADSNEQNIFIESGGFAGQEIEFHLEGFIDDAGKNVSMLTSWKQTMENWKDTITETISNIWLSLTGFVTRVDILESNIVNQTGQVTNETFPQYLKYLDSSDRKKIVCGYAEDNHLEHIEDLGYNCDITYKQTRRGEIANCRCKKL